MFRQWYILHEDLVLLTHPLKHFLPEYYPYLQASYDCVTCILTRTDKALPAWTHTVHTVAGSSMAFSHHSSDSVAFGISCGAGSRRTSRSLASGLAEEATVMGQVKCFMSRENSQFVT